MSTFSPSIRRSRAKFLLILIPVIGVIVLINLNILLNLSHVRKSQNSTSVKITRNCRDWHDYKQIYDDLMRKGIGEQGQGVKLTDPNEIALNKKFFEDTGFGVVVSDRISENRSIKDTRHPDCYKYLYPAELPNVSVIIIFYNEVFSVLQRTIHSVVNRTPPELLHEIILVNDMSTNDELYETLEDYIMENFKNTTIKIKKLTNRSGLIVTRLEGAEIATGDVLVFFDSHTEVNVNWLPPLLAPIKANKRLATIPTIDFFDPESFQVDGAGPYSDRNGFDWELVWHQFGRNVPEGYNKLKPFPNPIMLGCAFAIDRKFFMEELDGYDREFRIWNAENYELSLKLWLCADGLYETPCSRVTHTFRGHNPSRNNVPYDFLARNFKRLVETWFDDYKEPVYKVYDNRFKIDPGDLTHVKAVRERLKCKNFNFFIDHIFPEMKIRFPLDKKMVPNFASGQIRSVMDESICVDYDSGASDPKIRLAECKDEIDGDDSQFFQLNFYKNIIFGYTERCLDTWKMSFIDCHHGESGNQYWKLNVSTNMIISGHDTSNDCLTADFDTGEISIKNCDASNMTQKWQFTYQNSSALNNWKNIYGYEKFIYGDKADWSSMLPLEYNEECPM